MKPVDKVITQKQEIENLLKAISSVVANFGDGETKNYAHVGSLEHVLDELKDVAQFLNLK